MKPIVTKLPLISLILLLSLTTIAAQSKKCYSCNKIIESEYVVVEGKDYHPECLVCSVCKKQIKGGFEKYGGKYYHRDCYLDKFVDKCDICDKPLIGKYFMDVYDKKYHAEHENEIVHCNNCNRIICDNITNGGIKYKDGRNLCNLCYRNSANGQYEYDSILEYVLEDLDKMDLHINSENITIKAVNRDELRKAAGDDYSDMLKGYSTTEVRNGSRNSNAKHTVYALSLIPRAHIEAVAAHELMHVWLFQRTNNNHSSELREGACNYIAYLYMKSRFSDEAKNIIMLIDKNADPVYGDGFRKVKSKFQNRKLKDLLNYLKLNVDL